MNEDVKKWMLRAMEDWKVVIHERCLPSEEIPKGAVCFHCQQFVEKLLKSYLVLKGVDFGKTHNLEYLLELCKAQDSDFENIDVGNPTFYAVNIRYPDEFYVPTLEEAEECYMIAQRVKEFIEKKLNIMLENVAAGK
ncbi:MAG: HEPN domain-containing protein [Thermoplasmata archaeon]